jgi:hypothetical protein
VNQKKKVKISSSVQPVQADGMVQTEHAVTQMNSACPISDVGQVHASELIKHLHYLEKALITFTWVSGISWFMFIIVDA